PKAEPAPAPAAPPTPAPPAPQVAETPGPPAGPTPEQVARRREQLRESVANKGLLGLLGGRGATSTAAARGSILEGKGAAEDLDRVLARVDGLRAAPGGSGDQAGGGAPVLAAGLGEDALRAAAGAQRTVQLQDRADEAVETVEDQPLDELTLREAVAAIHRTVGTYLGGIRYLYNRELRKKPDLEGKLTVSMTIDPEGTVTACEVVESTLGYPPLEEAVLDRVRKWKFPPVAPRPITVTYPFVFFPSM
ncbi:MAG: AgmX/PglI C-terminal domain-containing protein, partial [Thermodesulfobacteriota bacterium]